MTGLHNAMNLTKAALARCRGLRGLSLVLGGSRP